MSAQAEVILQWRKHLGTAVAEPGWVDPWAPKPVQLPPPVPVAAPAPAPVAAPPPPPVPLAPVVTPTGEPNIAPLLNGNSELMPANAPIVYAQYSPPSQLNPITNEQEITNDSGGAQSMGSENAGPATREIASNWSGWDDPIQRPKKKRRKKAKRKGKR